MLTSGHFVVTGPLKTNEIDVLSPFSDRITEELNRVRSDFIFSKSEVKTDTYFPVLWFNLRVALRSGEKTATTKANIFKKVSINMQKTH